MDIAEVEVAVERIRSMAGDPEIAHSAEDDLRDRVLLAIANGADNPAGLARAVLMTGEIDFPRWCA